MALSWKHVVPWANSLRSDGEAGAFSKVESHHRSEFVQTYLDLYSKNSERQQKAIEKIALWECRVHNKLSVAIESSSALAQAQLLYQSAQEKGDSNNFTVRSTMTLALIRFVNHITEKGQNKPFAQPVHKIAEEFGIPEWIVRLRHDGSHGPVPCLELLCRGVQWALTYLQEVFWSQQVKEADEISDPSSKKRKKPAKSLYSTQEIQELVHSYRDASYKSLGEGADSEATREEKRILKRIEHILNGQQRNSVLRCLVEPGHLLPTEQQLRLYHVNFEEAKWADPPKVPEVLIHVWKDLLRLVQEKLLTDLLMQHLVVAMVKEADDSSSHSLMLLAWLRLMLLYEASNYSKTAEERGSQPALCSDAVEFSKELLLTTCVQNPSVLTCSLLRLADTGTFSENTFRKLEELENVYRGRGHTTASTSDKHHSDQDTETREQDSKHKPANAAAEDDNPWKLCTDPVDWEFVPIGALSTEIYGAGTGTGGEYFAQDYSSTSDNEGRSSEDEPDSTTFDPPAENSRKRSPEKSQDDIKKHFCIH